jgi:class 3 adenylate cyclase
VNQRYQVLVVEEGESNLSLLESYLRHSELEVHAAKAVEDLVTHCTSCPPDLIVIDLDDDNGAVDLCRRLKANPSTIGLPVLALAESNSREVHAFNAGVDEFLTRDVGRDEFLVRVNALLRVGTSRRAQSAAQFDAEARRLEQLRQTFRRYVSPQVADHIMGTGSRSSAENIRVRATVLFVDMRGFTRISELLSPGEVVPLLNEYFSLLTEIVFQHEGTVFNMAGDNLMVGFGVPVPQEDASVRAVRAALDMIAGFEKLARHWQQVHAIETGIGVGINEGDVIAGNVGSHAYMSYTIIGDAVNIAARLCQRARSGEILFSEAVKRSLDGKGYPVNGLELPPLVLRGRTTPVSMYCIASVHRKDIQE